MDVDAGKFYNCPGCIEVFDTDYAYTLDGDTEGEIQYENFNAARAVVEFTGVNVHPGSSKNTMDQVSAHPAPQQLLLSVDRYFSRYPALTLRHGTAEKKLRNGNRLTLEGQDGVYRVYSRGGDFLALSRLEQGALTTIKSFFEV